MPEKMVTLAFYREFPKKYPNTFLLVLFSVCDMIRQLPVPASQIISTTSSLRMFCLIRSCSLILSRISSARNPEAQPTLSVRSVSYLNSLEAQQFIVTLWSKTVVSPFLQASVTFP